MSNKSNVPNAIVNRLPDIDFDVSNSNAWYQYVADSFVLTGNEPDRHRLNNRKQKQPGPKNLRHRARSRNAKTGKNRTKTPKTALQMDTLFYRNRATLKESSIKSPPTSTLAAN